MSYEIVLHVWCPYGKSVVCKRPIDNNYIRQLSHQIWVQVKDSWQNAVITKVQNIVPTSSH